VRRVLVVEEGERIAALLRSRLGGWGWTVAVAADAVAAMGLLLDKHFDLIVIDLRLPDEGALEVVRVLHENDVMASVLVLANREDALATFNGLDGERWSPAR
jgi:two-component system phosphate regulon response regulator OmpR